MESSCLGHTKRVHNKPGMKNNVKHAKDILTRVVSHQPKNTLKCNPDDRQAMPKKYTNSISVQKANILPIDTSNGIFQIDDPDIDFRNFSYSLEQCDDNSFVLQKKLPTSGGLNISGNSDSSCIQDVGFINRSLEKNIINNDFTEHNVDKTNKYLEHDNNISSLEQKGYNIYEEQNVATHYFQNVVEDCSMDVDSESVWTPVTARQQLQEFLKFSKTKPNDENIGTDIENNRSVTSTDNNKVKFDKDGHFSISKMEITKEWMKNPSASDIEQKCRLIEYISSKIDVDQLTEYKETINELITGISLKLSKMWIKSNHNKQIFFRNYSNWLHGPPIEFTPRLQVKKTQVPLVYTRNPQPATISLDQLSLNTNADVYKFLKTSHPPFKSEMLCATLTSICKDTTKKNKHKLINFCQRYVSDMKFKWLTANQKEDLFKSKFEFWLNLNIRWPVYVQDIIDSKKPKADEVEKRNCDPITYPIEKVERDLTEKYSEAGQQNVSTVLHRSLNYPDDERIQGLITDSKCGCGTETEAQDPGPEEDPLQLEDNTTTTDKSKLTQYINPSGIIQCSEQSATTKPPVKLYKPSVAHLAALKDVLKKLKNETEGTKPQNPPRPIKPPNEIHEPSKSKERTLRPVLEKLKFLSEYNVASGTIVKYNNQSAIVMKVSNLKNTVVLVPNSNIKNAATMPKLSPSSKSKKLTTRHRPTNSPSTLNVSASQPNYTVPLSNTKKGMLVRKKTSNATETLATPITKSPIQTNQIKITPLATKSGVKLLQKTTNVPPVIKRAAVKVLLADISKGSLHKVSGTPTTIKDITLQNIKIDNTKLDCAAAVSALLADYNFSPKSIPSSLEESTSKARQSQTAEDLELLPWTEFLDEDF